MSVCVYVIMLEHQVMSSRSWWWFLCVVVSTSRTHDPDTRLLQLLQWRGVSRRMERRQDWPALSPVHSPSLAICMYSRRVVSIIKTHIHILLYLTYVIMLLREWLMDCIHIALSSPMTTHGFYSTTLHSPTHTHIQWCTLIHRWHRVGSTAFGVKCLAHEYVACWGEGLNPESWHGETCSPQTLFASWDMCTG